jgi:hypothetical protein
MQYSEIKRRYGFTEAESTLRGRYRTLTKRPEERRRVPVWRKEDEELLVTVVEEMRAENEGRDSENGGNGGRKGWSVGWKEVRERHVTRGASYAFGLAALRRKWEELKGGRRGK